MLGGLLAALITIPLAACGDQSPTEEIEQPTPAQTDAAPAPTDSPTPTPTDSPTPAPTPTATPTPSLSPTAAPATFQAFIADIEPGTPVRAMVAVLTEDEVACIQEDAGDEELYGSFLDLPSLTFLHLPPFLPSCIGLDRAVDLTTAVVFKAAGPPADIEPCIREHIAAVFASTPDSFDYERDFVCLPDSYGYYGDVDPALNLHVSDWVDTLDDDEVSCIYESAGGAEVGDLDAFIEELRRFAPLYLLNIVVFAPSCVDSQKLADVVTTALTSSVDLEVEIPSCVRDAIKEGYEDPPDPLIQLMGGPGYYSCLTRGQVAGLSTSELIVGIGGVTEDQEACIRGNNLDSLKVANGLRSGNPQDTIAITNAFTTASIYGCLPAEKVADLLTSQLLDDESASIDRAALIESIQCVGDLFEGRFVELYTEEVGPHMFGRQSNLTEEEQQAVDDFWESVAACEIALE